MATTVTWDPGDLEKQKDDIYRKILNAFDYAGQQFLINARGQMQDHAMGTYKDVTTNLRNSIDYYVFFNGELVSGGKTAEDQGQNLLLISDFINPEGFQLIGIAGMNYASHVESKGYNVISYQADICLVDLSLFLEDLDLIGKGTASQIEESFLPE